MKSRCCSIVALSGANAARPTGALLIFSLCLAIGLGVGSANAAAPPNDSFYSSKVIMGGSGSVAGNNAEATQELNEPAHAGGLGGASVWYTWYCSSAGTCDFSLNDAGFSYAIAVYVGKTLDTLTPVASAQNSSVGIDLSPGTVYRIAVDSLDAGRGTFALRWKQTFGANGGPDLVAPERLINIKVVEQNFDGSNCEVDERCLVAGKRRLLRFDIFINNIGKEDVVFGPPQDSPLFVYASCHNHYHFEALSAYRVLTVSNDLVRMGNKFGFCLEDVFNNSAPPETPRRFTCDDQGIQAGFGDIYSSDLPCQYVDVTGLPAGDYILEIEVDPLHKVAEASKENNITRVPFTLTEPCASQPANDDFLSPQVLSGTIVTALGDSTCATKQTGEPRHNSASPASKSIWFSWTAPTTGPVVMSTVGSAFDTIVAVYKGESLSDLATGLVAQGTDIDEDLTQDRLSFNATEGTTYRIAVDGINIGAGSQGGLVVMNVNPSANDLFDDCQALTGTDGSVQGTVSEATSEDGEPLHAGQAGGNSLWYCWTAPNTGVFSWDTLGSTFDTLLAVYTGDAVDSLTLVASDDDSGGAGTSRVSISATAGAAYRIAVDRKHGSEAPASSMVAKLNWHGPGFAQAPIIVEQPHSIATFISSNATLTVSASGSPVLLYQWFHGGQPVVDGDNVSGATTPNMHIEAIKETDRGLYQVQISNPQGTVQSAIVNLVAASRSRVLYVDPMIIPPGADVPVKITLAAKGAEHAMQFSISYNPDELSDPLVQPGADLPPGSHLETDMREAALGNVGITITLPPGAVLPVGDDVLATAWLRTSSLIVEEQRVMVCFEDLPVNRLVTGIEGAPLVTVYACGTLTGGVLDILSVEVLPDGSRQITLHCMPGINYEFQYSTDLQSWSPLATELSQSTVLTAPDSADHGSNAVFYRTVRK